MQLDLYLPLVMWLLLDESGTVRVSLVNLPSVLLQKSVAAIASALSPLRLN